MTDLQWKDNNTLVKITRDCNRKLEEEMPRKTVGIIHESPLNEESV